jgi:hypothetical protein
VLFRSYAMASSTNANSSVSSPNFSTSVSGYYVVPSYSAPGYDTLTHGQDVQHGGKYFQINRAYGSNNNSSNCAAFGNTQYMSKMC